MDPLSTLTGGTSVPLESVLCTEQLERRPSRPPDYQAENQALLALVQELKNSPGSVLQRLVDTALELCRGHSAGISLLEEGPPGHLSPRGDHFRWHAVAGQWAPLIWNTTTRRDYGPCGTVLDRNCTLLFANAHRYYRSSPAFSRCWSKDCWSRSTSTGKPSALFGSSRTMTPASSMPKTGVCSRAWRRSRRPPIRPACRFRPGEGQPGLASGNRRRQRAEEAFGRPTAARASSWRCWPMNCATRSRRSATPCRSAADVSGDGKR